MGSREIWSSGGAVLGATDDLVAFPSARLRAVAAAGGFSAGLRWTSRGTQPRQKSRERPPDPARRESLRREWPLPGQPLIGDQRASEPQLPESHGQEPAPAIGSLGIPRADRRPAERLFQEAEGVLHGEAAQVPAP